MLILCSGPDTFRAREKARDLADAFKAKHDPSGFSMETIVEPDFVKILNRLSAPSFFSSKRFLRCDGLLSKLKIADVRSLIKRIEADADQTIIVSVEEELPKDLVLAECKKAPFFHYSFPLLTGSSFEAWCLKRAEQLGVEERSAREIARATDRDIWLAEQELMKRSANPHAPMSEQIDETGTVFSAIDAYVAQQRGWRKVVAESDLDQFLVTVTSQVRSIARIIDGDTAGIHPYVVKKFSRSRVTDIHVRLMEVERAHVASRTGLATTGEVEVLL